ncbi:MAG: translocation/assembly module TamB domain-containing protein [Bacteroidota bacterium]
MRRRILKYFLFIGLSILLLLLVIAAITQTPFFKDRLRVVLIQSLSSQVKGSVQLGVIRGNFLTGFSIDSLILFRGDERFLKTGMLTIHYDPVMLVKKKLSIQHLSIVNPEFYLTRSSAGEWNFNTLLVETENKNPGVFDWNVAVKELSITGGSIEIVDSVALAQKEHAQLSPSQVDYSHIAIQGLELHGSGTYASENINLTIKTAVASALVPGYKPFSFAVNLAANKSGVTARNLTFSTGHSDIEMNAAIHKLNIFSKLAAGDIQNDSVAVHLLARKIDFGELESILHFGRTLKGSMFVQMDAVGTFGNLSITRLQVQTPRSLLKLSGTIKNLHNPKEIVINAVLGDSKIDGPELAALLPQSEVLNLENAGVITSFIQYSGTLNDFTAAVSLKGKFGDLEAKGKISAADTIPKYDIVFSTRAFDIQKMFHVDIPITGTMEGTLKGAGTTLDNIASTLTLDIDTVKFRRTKFAGSKILVNAAPHHLDGTIDLHGGESVLINASTDFKDERYPSLTADVVLNSFDCSGVFPDSTLRTSLSLKANLSTVGKTVDDLSGTLSLDTYDCLIKGADISNKHLDLTLNQRNLDERSLVVKSSVADAELKGKFDLDIVEAYLTEQIPHLFNRIAKHASADTSQRINQKAVAIIQKHSSEGKNLDFDYSIDIKDFSPVSRFISSEPMSVNGKISGRITGDAEQLSLNTNAKINNLVIGEGDSARVFDSASVNFDIHNITLDHTLRNISGNLTFSIQKASLPSPTLTNFRGSATFGDSRSTISLYSTLDSNHSIALHGNAIIEPRTYQIDLDTLRYTNTDYSLVNRGDIKALINPAGISITEAIFKHEGDSVTVSGIWKGDRSFDAQASLPNFPLQELNTFFHSVNAKHRDIGFKGKSTVDIHLSGTPENPVIQFKATSDSTYYRLTKLGWVNANISYENRVAQVDITTRPERTDSMPNLEIYGTLPINLAFKGVSKRFPDIEQDLHVRSNGFELGILQWIFPELENLSGAAVSDLHITGTPQEPDYAGSFAVKNAHFIFAPNNIPYIMEGTMVPKGNKISLENYTIKNVPEEQLKGTMKVDGTLTIKNFDLESFDLTANGDLLVVSEATRRNLSTFYGTIFIETASGGAHFSGTQDHPNLTGQLNIREANLVFPPATGEVAGPSTQTLPYIVVNDTAKVSDSLSRGQTLARVKNDTTGKIHSNKIQTATGESFLSKLRYDVILQTEGKTSVTMIFTPTTNEELYAELDGKVNVVNDHGTPAVFGDISIGSQSYYNFIKRFTASGKLQYVGPWDNPTMNILATYEGYKQNVLVDTTRTSTKSNTQDKVIVELNISGTRKEPKLVMGMKVQTDPNKDPIDWSTQAKGGDVQSDVFSFLMTGKFYDELTAADNAAISNVGSSVSSSLVSGFTSNLLSGIFTNFLQKEFPFIQSASVSYEGGNPDLRISGEVAKGNLRFGGKVLNDIGNANVSYQLSLGEMLNARSIRNLFIELDHKVEGTYIDESHKNATTNSARIYYRISF